MNLYTILKIVYSYEDYFDKFYYFPMTGDGGGDNINNIGITDKHNAFRHQHEKYGNEVSR